MREADVFVLADRTLNDVVQQIADDQWTMTMPPSFAMRQRDQFPTLRDVINYHAYDEAWVPDMLAGRTMDQVGRDKFDGDLLGADPKVSFAALVDTACAAAGRLDDPARIVHCSFGDFSAREYFWQINGFRGLRAHDLALVIGVEPRLPDELVRGLWEEISPHAEEWREYGVFPPAVPVPESAPLLDRLLGLTGRPPTPVLAGQNPGPCSAAPGVARWPAPFTDVSSVGNAGSIFTEDQCVSHTRDGSNSRTNQTVRCG